MITGLYAGILALVYLVLSVGVIAARKRHQVKLGDGQNGDVLRAVRIHGNFAEYVPFALLLMALYETQAGNMYLLHVFGILLIAGRLLHIVGLRRDALKARVAGMALTFALFAVLGVLLILKGIRLLQVL